jgi:hypothetical protein
MSNQETVKTLLVTGDAAIDWNIIIDANEWKESPNKLTSGFSRICGQPGGVLLISELLSFIVDKTNDPSNKAAYKWQIKQTQLSAEEIRPDNEKISHSFVSWDKFPEKKGEKTRSVWRVKELWGVEKAKDIIDAPKLTQSTVLSEDTDADIILIDDADLGFRDKRELWPKAILETEKAGTPLIMLKMSDPVMQGALWEHLHSNFADHLIVIVSIDDLRKSEVQISRELSWERTAQDTVNEFVYNPAINALTDCKNVVLIFKNAGAIVISNENNADADIKGRKIPECNLIFDPKVIEGTWESKYEGRMLGYNTCLTAGIVRQCLLDTPCLEQGIIEGLSAMRVLHKAGFSETENGKGQKIISFPFERIYGELTAKASNDFSKVPIRSPQKSCGGSKAEEPWTILKEKTSSDMNKLAYDIVEQGAQSAIKDIPLGIFEKMLTIDRFEIEGFRSIRTLVKEYCAKGNPERPLSIAVFGPPGSGKSFGVKQISKSLPYNIEEITFNLSQMKSSDELTGAFHQIRDKVLKGVIPLVFWDEFDSKLDNIKLGWLRYFLAPMQDGEFSEGRMNHPIGRAIFVFAGGTSVSFEKFVQTNEESFIEVKGPDFASRLRGYVNILGANPPKKDEQSDTAFVVRRAILLRSVIERSVSESLFSKKDGKKILNIDRGVLRAFLHISNYYHGVRSMEAIISMSMLAGRKKYERSSLPSAAQLNVHVDGDEFLKLANSIILEGQTLEKLAQASHNIFYSKLKEKGYRFGLTRNHEGPVKTHPLFIEYEKLSEYYKESNRENVRDIPEKLARIDCVMTVASADKVSYKLEEKEIEYLAELEHDRYIEHAVRNGWHYGDAKEKLFPVDPTLLPWVKMTKEETDRKYPLEIANSIGLEELPEFEKEKDRELIEAIPDILEKAGFIVEKLQNSK